MIISKKKFEEKIQEAIHRVEVERYIHEKIDRVQRELEERINGISRHLCELDRDISKLAEEVRGEYINAKKG